MNKVMRWVFVLSYGRHNLFVGKTYGEHRLWLNSPKRKALQRKKNRKRGPPHTQI